MEDPVDQQRFNAYQNKVSDWIGRQGFLFQLRYGRTVGSISLARHLGQLSTKVVFFLIVSGIFAFSMVTLRFGSSDYRDNLARQVADALGAEEVEVTGFSRNAKTGEFQHLELDGGAKSFFYDAKFEKVTGVFSFLTGVIESWRPSAVRIKKANLRLRAGGDEDEMRLGFASIVEGMKGEGISQIEIDDCSFSWGYSKLTFGAVLNSNFRATLQDGVWGVELSGGSFQQNWLGPFDIESATLRVDTNGIRVSSLKLRKDGGSADLKGSISGPINMPTFNLRGGFTSLPVEELIRVKGLNTRDYIEGRISGSLAIDGSSNRRVELSGQVSLNENDRVTIRERWSLLRALSILDGQRTYLRVDFNQGGFAFATGGGRLEIDAIDLTAGNKARLLGGFKTRLPTQTEAADALGIRLTNNFALDHTDSSLGQQLENDRMRIDSSNNEKGYGINIQRSVEDGKRRVTQDQLSDKALEALRMREEMEIHRITGSLKLAVPSDSFDSNKALLKIYPVDRQGWRWIPVELKDANFMNMGDKTKELLLKKSLRRASSSVEDN